MWPERYGPDYHDCTTCCSHHSTGNDNQESKAELQNYEVVYHPNGEPEKQTRIVEADEVQFGDFIEFWNGDALMLMVRDEHLVSVHNLALFMKDEK